MAKKLIIIGNGLGMAIEPEHFNLSKAMERVWNGDILTREEKTMLGAIEGVCSQNGPQSEEQLINVQLARDIIPKIFEIVGKTSADKWLTNGALDFPNTRNKYIFHVAKTLFDYDSRINSDESWKKFRDQLISFIKSNKPNIATLNYDGLVYEAILEIPKSSLYMVDGFIQGSFKSSNYTYVDRGSYMHLHGTPTFTTEKGSPKKLRRHEIPASDPTVDRHLVLANALQKKEIIGESDLLQQIWQRFETCVKRASEIIFFGYGGEDDHLNRLIMEKAANTPKWVMEWKKSPHIMESDNQSTEKKQSDYWAPKLGEDLKFLALDSILDFTEWDDPGSHIPF